MRENEQGLEHRCAFCREPVSNTMGEINKNIMKKISKRFEGHIGDFVILCMTHDSFLATSCLVGRDFICSFISLIDQQISTSLVE